MEGELSSRREVITTGRGHDPTTRRSLQEPKLQQVRLNHGFKSGGVLAQRCRQGIKPGRATSMGVEQQLQQPAIAGIKPSAIHPMQGEGFIHQRLIDRAGAITNTGHIPHSP